MRTLFIVLILSSLQLLQAAEPMKHPNIVFCFADDWGRYASAYRELDKQPSPNHVVKTPNVDSIAKRGVLFNNAYVCAPSCTPCRSALLSGRYFFNCGQGAILNGAVWDSKIPSFPLLLRDQGYSIGKTGKVWSPGTPADAPIGGQQYSYQQSGMSFMNFSEHVTAAMKKGSSLDEAKQKLAAEVRGNFQSFLKAREAGKPFLYWFGPTTVHRTWVKGSGKALWQIEPDQLQGKLPPFLPDVPEVREDFADYLGEIQAWDFYVGTILDELKQSGELNNTIVVISGDHGAPGFPAGKCNLYDFGTNVMLTVAGPNIPGGRVIDDFVNLMDLTPTFLDIGQAKHPEQINGRSLWPVLMSTKSGQVDPARDYVITGRERHVASARAGNLPYPQRALRTKDYLYIRNFKPDRYPLGDPGQTMTTEEITNNTRAGYADMDASPTKAWLVEHRDDQQWKWHVDYAFGKRPGDELYDLKSDPHQIKNVAADPQYAEILKAQQTRLTKLLTEAGDPRVVEADCRFEKAPFVEAETGKGKGKAK
jgi:N-sulfoglucosamine sulfohydrolase